MRISRTQFSHARPGPARGSRPGLKAAGALLAASALAFGAAACSEETADDAGTAVEGTGQSETAGGEQAGAADAETPLSLADGWSRTTDDEAMTSVFGQLVNNTESEIRVVGGQSDRAGVVELHEVINDGTGSMTMQEKEGGFVIPAGASHELIPGGDHLMLMELDGGIGTGEEVAVTLEFDDGTTQEVAAYGRDFEGADEDYGDLDQGGMDHEGMDHGEMGDGESDDGEMGDGEMGDGEADE